MTDVALIYRDQIVRAVLGTRPAILADAADIAAVDRLARRLADAEAAHELLRAKGHGDRGMTIAEVAKAVPEKSA